MKKPIFFSFFLLSAMISFADIRLPSVIGNNMILQQQSAVKLWGWSSPAEKIYITTSWNNKTDSVVATRDANWQMTVQTPPAGGPYSITFRGNNQVVLNNVLIGEVWVCSGQSNMEMSEGWGLKDVKAALPTCYNKNIRFFYIPKTTSDYPQDDCKGAWEICDSNAVKNFSAAGYFFGRKLNEALHVPIGLINSNWGGTAAEVWTPAEVVYQNDSLKAAAAKLKPFPQWPHKPGVVFNAMISPITNYSIAGAIWYQGEGNTGTASTYCSLFTSMIDAWRKKWDKELPFYYVQIAPFNYGDKNVGALLQEAQTKSMQHQHVGMVVISDLVDDVHNIHPQDKHDVGYRLANWALAETYHRPGIIYKSPVFNAMDVQAGKAIISFENAKSGLESKSGAITELYIAGADKIFYPAKAKIDHDKLVVWSKAVPQPAAVRYAFGNTAIGNLFSKEGLPVTAFRTDSWEIDTSSLKP